MLDRGDQKHIISIPVAKGKKTTNPTPFPRETRAGEEQFLLKVPTPWDVGCPSRVEVKHNSPQHGVLGLVRHHRLHSLGYLEQELQPLGRELRHRNHALAFPGRLVGREGGLPSRFGYVCIEGVLGREAGCVSPSVGGNEKGDRGW